MKNKSSLSFTLVWPVAMLLLSFAGCCNEDATDSFSELMEDFTDPPAGYRPAAGAGYRISFRRVDVIVQICR